MILSYKIVCVVYGFRFPFRAIILRIQVLYHLDRNTFLIHKFP
jgi:hypothetical protein